MNHNQNYTVNRDAFGRVRMWEHSPTLGYGKLLLDQSNIITKTGASLAAASIAGLPNSVITHMYVGYNNGTVTPTIEDTVSSFATYAKIPLAFSPSFASSPVGSGANYVNNIVYFTVYLTGSSSPSGIPNSSTIDSLGLVCGAGSGDLLFSKIAFSPVTYNASTGIAISWGVTFLALAS